MVTIAAVADATRARVQLTLSGGVAGSTLFVLRRDSAGAQQVRDTSEGTLTWPSSGAVTVFDYEAAQGQETDYIATDSDGRQLAATRISLPRWGTWVKSPGRPYLNVRCHLARELPVVREARRSVLTIENSRSPVVLSQPRMAPTTSAVELLTLDGEQLTALTHLLDDGSTVLLDTDPDWRVPFRYVSVGTHTTARAYFEDLGLQIAARLHSLADVIEVEAPIGVSSAEVGRTYSSIPTGFGTYASIPALVSTYEELATGTRTGGGPTLNPYLSGDVLVIPEGTQGFTQLSGGGLIVTSVGTVSSDVLTLTV